MVVTLEKWDFFDIEFSQSCDWDYIEIFDGPDTNSPSLGRFCGREAPKYIRYDLTHNFVYNKLGCSRSKMSFKIQVFNAYHEVKG